MFQFRRFPRYTYFEVQYNVPEYEPRWVSSFRNLRINAYLQLPEAFRSLSRLSSAPSAKAFALRPCSLDLSNVLSEHLVSSWFSLLPTKIIVTLPFEIAIFLKRTYYNLCFAVIIQFSRYVLVMSLKARSPETLIFITWWAKMDSNHRPHDYQSCALASWAIGPYSLTSSWWRLAGSNRWPPACKAGALPAELNPHIFTILT